MNRARFGGNGREALIDFDSLPVDIQTKLGDPRKVGHILERFYKTDTAAVRFYQDHTFDDVDSSHIKDEIQVKYVVNASMLRAVHDLKIAREHEIISKGLRPRNLFQSLCADAESFNPVLLDKYGAEHTLPANYRRFKDVYDKFMEHGYISLISAKHKNKNSAKVDEQVLEFINNLFGDKVIKPNVADAYRQYCDFKGGFCEIFNNSTSKLLKAQWETFVSVVDYDCSYRDTIKFTEGLKQFVAEVYNAENDVTLMEQLAFFIESKIALEESVERE